MRYQSHRTALSLIELLVVIAILGTFLGLLLPAIQKVRAAGLRTECANHLKQVGLALHAYHDAQHVLPPGMSLNIDGGAYPYLSWNVRILPFLEQSNLWKDIQTAYNINRDFLFIPPHIHRKTIISTFVCPADARSASIAIFPNEQVVAFTSYLGVEGTDQFKRDGILFLDSQVRFAEVTDGLSNTLLVGERPPSADDRFGWWYAGWGQHHTGSAEMILGVREQLDTDEPCLEGPYHFGPGSDNSLCDFLHFWSQHPGGGHFLFADGSVRFVTYNADSLMPALATRAGSEPFETP